MSERVPDWFYNAVVDGIQRLHVLSLQGTPAAETVTLTAQVWIDTLWHTPRSWDEARDLPRLQEAFRAIAGRVDRWPAPRAVLEHLPPIPQPRALPAPPLDPAKAAQVRTMLRELTARLKGKS